MYLILLLPLNPCLFPRPNKISLPCRDVPGPGALRAESLCSNRTHLVVPLVPAVAAFLHHPLPSRPEFQSPLPQLFSAGTWWIIPVLVMTCRGRLMCEFLIFAYFLFVCVCVCSFQVPTLHWFSPQLFFFLQSRIFQIDVQLHNLQLQVGVSFQFSVSVNYQLNCLIWELECAHHPRVLLLAERP